MYLATRYIFIQMHFFLKVSFQQVGEELYITFKTMQRLRPGTDTIEFQILPYTPNGEGTQTIKTAINERKQLTNHEFIFLN